MPKTSVQALIKETFLDMAEALESGRMGGRPKIALTGIGSELGEENALAGAVLASRAGVDVTYIGTLTNEAVTHVFADNEDEAHQAMERLLDEGAVAGAVTMHYPFPIGVATVGRVVIPANGREMFLATTTGTASTDRVTGMVQGAIYGIIAAKACGLVNPSVGILNIDGARQTEIVLNKLIDAGYPITLAQSGRADGGCIMRGNDVLAGSADVMVTDTLTGNLVIKMVSSFGSGGTYESLGYGYGPGIGEDYDRLVMIVSRASGASVISGALRYAATLIQNDYQAVIKREFELAKKAGLKELLSEITAAKKAAAPEKKVIAPPKEIVTCDIAGIDVMDLENAVELLWENGIYAESGMGCTGPIVLIADDKLNQSAEILRKGGFIS
ncbi:MAG: glycine reductase [Clostridiales bacterium]|nr:glycine reductase [Clostridiales bacterium]